MSPECGGARAWLAPDLDARIKLDALQEQWGRVDWVGAVLVALARERVDRP